MCCLVAAGTRRILIDPGIALGYERHGLLPHPCQVAAGIRIREKILQAIHKATDVVFSHFHGDHIPLRGANPYQLSFRQLPGCFQKLHCWSPAAAKMTPRMQQRAEDLTALLGASHMRAAVGHIAGPLRFSKLLSHGMPGGRFGNIMMTRIELGGGQVFVHASDTQLLDEQAVEIILDWQPSVVLAAGPPLYLQSLAASQRKKAWEHGVRLARNVAVLIVDHHVLRSEQGILWLERLSQTVGKKVYCAADFMGQPRLLLEARRRELYSKMPVPEQWHHDYAHSRIAVEPGTFERCIGLLA